MSFRQNGRYGYVPPAQYGGGQPTQNSGLGLHRSSSFDNGDDAPFFQDPNGNRPATTHMNPYGSQRGPGPGPTQDELYLDGPDRPPPRPPYIPNSSGAPTYQNQYHSPQSAQPASPAIPAYNPQQFARTLSQSQAPATQYNQQAYPSHNYSPQSYNPAAYQSQASQHRHPSQSPYMSAPSYGTPPLPQHNAAYGTPIITQGPQSSYWTPPAQYNTSPQVPMHSASQQIYDQGIQTPYVPSGSAPLPARPSQYQSTPVSMPYPANGGTYSANDYRPTTTQSAYPQTTQLPAPSTYGAQYDDYNNSFSARVSRSSSHNNTPLPTTAMTIEAPLPSPGLQRHPTHRPLPTAPVDESESDSEGSPSAERRAQEQIYQEIEAAVASGGARRDPQSAKANGDLLDDELGDLRRYNSTATTLNPTGTGDISRASTLHQNSQSSYDFQDDSDAEAAAGLEAMRLADQEEMRGNGPAFGRYDQHNHLQVSQEASSDSDYGNVDLGQYGGDYSVNLSYGQDLISARHSSEMEDQSRPLPTSYDLRRQDAHEPAPGLGGMRDYSLPIDTAIDPSRGYDNGGDSFETGGLQRPGHAHRLSFDEGDEQSLGSRYTESRLSGRSGSDSPTRDDIPEMFYHPGMSSNAALNRPLPAVPSMHENRAPQLGPAGSYRNNYNQYQVPQESAKWYPAPDGPDAYPQHDLLSPGTPFVPRSASLTSHSSTPLVVPPVRSRTDAEERQAKQRALRQHGIQGAALDGYETGTPQSATIVDLPALPPGRRRKTDVEQMRSGEFRKCREPWALSGVAAWIREMLGGETGDGEADLREKTIADCLVALFTHKVPTMNTADAEAMSAGIIASMFAAGVLVRDEEWVRFGQGTISGVLWQMTGSGCYAPKLHEPEIHGRCYSHHCSRTLKKINLHAQNIEPAKKSEPWHIFFKVTDEQLAAADKKEIQRQNNLHEIIMSEDKFIDNLNVLRIIYRDDLQSWQPPIIGHTKLPRFINQVFGKVEAIKRANEDHLLAQLKYRQQEQGPWIAGFSDIFREWIRRARQVYLEYAAGYPNANFMIRKEADRNLLFRQFLDQAQANKLSNRLDWNTYLFAPIKRLQQYTLLLREVCKHSYVENEEKANLMTAIEEINAVTHECDARVDEENKKVAMAELHAKLYLRPGMERVELQLDHLGRELIMQGDLQRAGANRFTWLDTHAILFDHYLVLAKTVAQRDTAAGRRKEIYDVSKLPIPMQLLVLESANDEPVVKSSMKGLGAVTTVTRQAPSNSETRPRTSAASERPNSLQHTNTGSSADTGMSKISSSANLEADARSMYPFRIKHLGKSEVYTLYAPSAQNRQDWCDKIIVAKERHAASLFAQNAEPFRLRILADNAFAYDAATAGIAKNTISIRGTPLDRAIREMDREYGGARLAPVCRATVNCATTFTCYGKSMIAIGTDYGVFTSEIANPRGWTRAIVSTRVTQISVLEDFSLCLIIADKSLIAYHLDVIVPVSNFPAPQHDSARRAPQKLSGARDVSFFSTARMKDRTLVFYKKREGLSSTFKVLEPVFQKSSEKKSKLFGRSRIGGGGTTEFFREFDEFYIPAECFTINLFHTYIAISTARGFELLTLDKKVPMSIPDLKQPSIASIAARLAGQKPLGMFRLSDAEFLLCYEECGVYIDKHGDVSRSVVLEFVGKAKTAAMYGAYLVLFDSDFVEVRNAENGRLRQIIAGRDVRCLDYGVLGAGSGVQRTLKVAMAHPEMAGSQLVVELVLNEGQREE